MCHLTVGVWILVFKKQNAFNYLSLIQLYARNHRDFTSFAEGMGCDCIAIALFSQKTEITIAYYAWQENRKLKHPTNTFENRYIDQRCFVQMWSWPILIATQVWIATQYAHICIPVCRSLFLLPVYTYIHTCTVIRNLRYICTQLTAMNFEGYVFRRQSHRWQDGYQHTKGRTYALRLHSQIKNKVR